jgi:serine/threonine-protein kinase
MPQPKPAPAGDSPEMGARLLNERYRLLDVVGEGGMAVVWRAEDTMLHRTVAVKVLREQYASDPEFLERFRTEARSAAALNHPGVVAVHDVGEDEGCHYLVMEYVPGRDLKARIRAEAPLSVDQAVAIAHAVAEAVAAAHEAGMVHRDVKPQNVLVSPDGRMKVADFGIARAVSAAGLTAPGLVMGTVHYIAPEQAGGAPATPASDVYSLGVVLYEMLTGRVPHEADSSLGVAMKVMQEDPLPASELNPAVPPALSALLDQAMARDPAERFPDAGALASRLERYRQVSSEATGPLPTAGASLRSHSSSGRRAASGPKGGSGSGVSRASSRSSLEGRSRWAALRDIFDWRGLGLGLVAVAAMAGLIVLWIVAVERLQGGSDGGALGGGAPASTEEARALPPVPVVPASPTPIREVSVPDLSGLDRDEAAAALEEIGLSASLEPDFEPGSALYQVLKQRPTAGEVVPEGTVVKVVYADTAPILVPRVVGDPAQMQLTLQNAGFTPQRRDVWRGGASPQRGQVIGLDPLPQTEAAIGSTVIYNVDSGDVLPLGVTFENGIYLQAVQLFTDTFAAGELVRVSTRWSAVEPVDRDYEARVVLGDVSAFNGGGGVVLAETARSPVDGRPTSTWPQAEPLDGASFELVVPPDAAAGDYVLWLELFPPDAPELRLSVASAPMVRLGDGGVQIRAIEVVTP